MIDKSNIGPERRQKGVPVPEIDKQVAKEAVKEALKEWLDEKYAQFGKWTFHSLIAAALAGAVYIAFIGQGWHK